MKWKHVILGAPEVDENDPKNKARAGYIRSLGSKFAHLVRADKGVAFLQRFAESRPKLFLGASLGTIALLMTVSTIRLFAALKAPVFPAPQLDVRVEAIEDALDRRAEKEWRRQHDAFEASHSAKTEEQTDSLHK